MVGMNAQDFFYSAYYSTALAYVNQTKVSVSTEGIKLVMTNLSFLQINGYKTGEDYREASTNGKCNSLRYM
jgi:hypothetical protein